MNLLRNFCPRCLTFCSPDRLQKCRQTLGSLLRSTPWETPPHLNTVIKDNTRVAKQFDFVHCNALSKDCFPCLFQFRKDRLDEYGQRLVLRNGHLPEREVISGVGPLPVRQLRVRPPGQVPFPVRFCPSICVGFPASML
jgi:hypothetical protein